MNKKNLFIVNTPFHLLTAFILSKSFQHDKNYLVLMHPHGYEKWQDSKVMTYLSSTRCGYEAVFPLNLWLSSKNKRQSYRRQVEEVKASIGRLMIDDIYLGSDIDVQNQLLVGVLGKDRFYRYEDGLYSYYNEDRRRPLLHMLFHRFKIELIKLFAGIEAQVFINTSTAGDNRSGVGDFFYKPQLLKRYSPQTFEIKDEMIHMAISDLFAAGVLETMVKERSVLYLSQPLVEQGRFTLEEEFQRLQYIYQNLPEGMVLLYKEHPNDRADKLSYYKKKLPKMVFFNSIAPVELSFCHEENLVAVISYQSSALMFIDKFTQRKIRPISLARFYSRPLHQAYMEIMCQAGVMFPGTMAEVCQCISEK